MVFDILAGMCRLSTDGWTSTTMAADVALNCAITPNEFDNAISTWVGLQVMMFDRHKLRVRFTSATCLLQGLASSP